MATSTTTSVAATALLLSCAAPEGRGDRASAGPSIERGKYLVAVIGCSDCHTPFRMTPSGPEPDLSRAFSGHPAEMELPPTPPPQGPWLLAGVATNTAFAGPWGISYATHLTPDQDTGLGVFTEASFITAMRTGKHLGTGRPILPPMPWAAYANMSDEDLTSVFAYLQTLPSIRNAVPQASLALPPGV